MGGVDALLEALSNDPVLAYSLLAAALLACVSVVTGLLRLDLGVLFRPRILLRVAGAVMAAFLLTLAATVVTDAGGPALASRLLGAGYRLPLYLIALAYGPSVGLFAAGLYAAFQASNLMPGWHEAILALELLVVGWLAIYPSPRGSRWAGPFDAVVAYVLAWGTGGLALLQSRAGAVTLTGVWAQHVDIWDGLLVVALALAAVGPRAYARWFPESRIAPPSPMDVEPSGRSATLQLELAGRDERVDIELTHPKLPRVLQHGRGLRELEPLPFRPEQEPLR